MSRGVVLKRPLDWSQDLADYVVSVSWSPDGRFIAAAEASGPVTVFDLVGTKASPPWSAHVGGTFRAAFSPREDVVASVGQDGYARLWRPGSAVPFAEIPAGAAWVEQLAWAPDGSLLAVAAGRQASLLRPDGTLAQSLATVPSTLTALAWRADARVLAASAYGRVQRWDAASGREEAPLTWKTSLISLAWSPDQRWIVAGTQEQTVQIWELPARPNDELAMSGYTAKVRELAWHHGGRYLATGGGEEIMVWDCGGSGPAGTTPRVLEGHEGRVTALAYQHAGHLLASGGEDGSVFLWNAGKASTPLRQFHLSSPITYLDWSRDDQRLAIGCQGGAVAAATIPA